MLLRIEASSRVALHDQIASGIRRAIADGELTEGEQLPTARELADGLDVNMHTVLRGYAALRDEGLLEFRRGRGVKVVAGRRGRAKLLQLARELAAEAEREGLTIDEACSLLREVGT